MNTMIDNIDVECFIVTKHSWKGKYRRILSVGSHGISTYSPDKFEITNKWIYADIISVIPIKNSNINNEFQITIKKDRKMDTIKLSSEFRTEILSILLQYHKEYPERQKVVQKFQAYKFHWSGISLPTVLQTTPCSIDQLDPTTNVILTSYLYKDIQGIIGIQDYDGGIVMAYGGFSRLHLFKVQNHHEIVQNIVKYASQYLGIDIKILKSQINLHQFQRERFGEYSGDQYQTSMAEFTVQKITPRHPDSVKRFLCLTETTILERDPQTYSICTLRPLNDIYALVRNDKHIQKFSIEYKNGFVRTYIANDRDSILATILDSVRSSGNENVHVRATLTPRGKRVVPLIQSVDEETEANLLRLIIHNYQIPQKRFDILERFNANIPHSGLNYSVTQDSLFAENKEKLILSALQALAQKEVDNPTAQLSNIELEANFHALRRLLASKVGYAAFTTISGFREIIGSKIVAALRKNDMAVTYAAVDVINSLMHSINVDYDLKQEQLNKSSVLSSKSFLETLLNMWTKDIIHGSGALILSAMLDFLTFALCVPYSETTDGKQFDILLEMVAERGRFLYKLFQHPSLAIVKGAGLVLRAIIEEGEDEIAKQMQMLALDEAALCKHLLVALYTPLNDLSLITHRQLSRHLIGLWITDNKEAMELLYRIFPAGLLTFFESEEPVPENSIEEDKLNFRDNLKLAIQHSNKNAKSVLNKHIEGIKHWGLSLIDQKAKVNQTLKNRPIVLRNRRKNKKESDGILNFPYFFYNFSKDHNLPNLIWNHKTREELRTNLENELRQFMMDKELAGNILVAWNHQEFEVQYQCLADEMKIGDYYIRLILELDDWPPNLVKDPVELFNALYRRVLCRNRINDDQMTVISVQALAKVYKQYHEVIGKFNEMPYILQLLDRCFTPSLRDALIILIKNLVLNKSNCRAIANYASCLVDLLTLAHLHTSRAVPNTKTNIIEASPNMKAHEEKEWYFNYEKENEKSERKGPVTFSELKDLWNQNIITARTRCWAAGMDGWRSLQQITQLKWCLMAKGNSIFNETDLSTHILDILIKCTSYFPSRTIDGEAILVPGPKLSRKLSEVICLPHIVQVCLTHDPRLLERVATLLCQVMQDNPEISKVYITGVFYFMLMYTGSNILPIAKFLKVTHMKQAFRREESTLSGIMQKSILGPMLPEAMVCFLENHSAEKFAEIFLGEFDTPEVIWSSEMRRMLIEKICAHIADFSPRLKGHTMARYPYLAIPAISYPQLENELYCHIYYLRHLCDTNKFPNWPISDPVLLLKHTLDSWKKEVEKKPPEMTIFQAYEELGIENSIQQKPDESVVRKNYYRLAQMYHPDKNPNGRERFDQISRAYEFLCSRSVLYNNGPNPKNIYLILKTQSILFDRFATELKPYKYAGYPQLIKTLKLETKDEQLFSKEVPLLTAAAELCYYTVKCSALNAEELRRNDGLEALLEAYSRCVSILSNDSKVDSLHYQVITNVSKCFEVACLFEKCKQKMINFSQLIKDVCHVVYFKHPISISLVTNLAINDNEFQCNLVRNGVLWSLILFLFEYDYTLNESGVESTEESNSQKAANNLAKLSTLAILALNGYEFRKPKENDKIQEKPQNKILHQKTSYTENAQNLIHNSKQLNKDNCNESYIKDNKSGNTQNLLEKENILNGIKYELNTIAKNTIVKQILDKLLTSYITNKLLTEDTHKVLKLLTSNTRNPYIIWDNGTRAQLTDFLEQQRQHSLKYTPENIESVLKIVSEFEYDVHRNELRIGDIFISVYNEMPAFPITDPKSFIINLLKYLKNAFAYLVGNVNILKIEKSNQQINLSDQKQSLFSRNSSKPENLQEVLSTYNQSKRNVNTKENLSEFTDSSQTTKYTIMALKALSSVIKANTEIEIQCIGYFDLIFEFLANKTFEGNTIIKSLALEIIALASRSKQCLNEMAACDNLGSFLIALKDTDLKDQQLKVLETLSGLINSSDTVKEGHSKGVVIYLLDLFCNSRSQNIRELSAEILSKTISDRLSGPKVRITLTKFLPGLFVDAIVDSPQLAVQLFESIHEHPELIWNDETRTKVCDHVAVICNKFYQSQRNNTKILWQDPKVLKEITSDELVISGVYLRLFVQNPAWTLRKPKQFLADLLDFVVNSLDKSQIQNDEVDLATKALVDLLRAQPHLMDEIPILGHLPRIFALLPIHPDHSLQIIHQISLSEFCVMSLSQTGCISPLKKCMEKNKRTIEKVCEILSRFFKYQNDSLVNQSLETNLVLYLLELLESRLEYSENPSASKALIVVALKAMTSNVNYGDKVTNILLTKPIWESYKDQKHDLFITDIDVRGYLTGINPTAGYLTQTPNINVEVLTSPPPIDKEDPLARQME